jgi:hypothetical protein
LWNLLTPPMSVVFFSVSISFHCTMKSTSAIYECGLLCNYSVAPWLPLLSIFLLQFTSVISECRLFCNCCVALPVLHDQVSF